MKDLNSIKNNNDKHLIGNETFSYEGVDTDMTVIDFWRWYFSDLYDIKSKIAEYLVSKALGLTEAYNTGYWSAHSIKYRDKKIEIREASYIRSTGDNNSSKQCIKHIDIRARDNDFYIFCFNVGKTIHDSNPLILDNWEFYVVPTWYIESESGNKNTICLSKVRRLVRVVKFPELKDNIDKIIDRMSKENIIKKNNN